MPVMGDLGPTREQSGSGLLEHIMSKSPKAIVVECSSMRFRGLVANGEK